MAESGEASTYINVKYIYQCTTPSLFDADFTQCLAARMAASLAYVLTGNAELAKSLEELSETFLQKGKASNVVEGLPWWADTVYRAVMGLLAEAPKQGVGEYAIATKFRSCYVPLRNALLREYHWGFATKRVALVVLSTAPVSGYLYQYTLPTDYLDAQDISYSAASEYSAFDYPPYDYLPFWYPPFPPFRYAIENNVLLTDSDSVILTYTALVTDSTKFDPMFTAALAARIAAHIAAGLYGNATLAASLRQLAEIELGKARMADATEGTPQVARRERSWIDAR